MMMSPHSCALQFFGASHYTRTLALSLCFSLSRTHTLMFFSLTHAHPFCLFFLALSLSLSSTCRAHTRICTQMESPTWLGDLPCLRCLTLIRPTEAGCITTPTALSLFCPDVPCGAWGKYPQTVRPSETSETETKRQLSSAREKCPLYQFRITNISKHSVSALQSRTLHWKCISKQRLRFISGQLCRPSRLCYEALNQECPFWSDGREFATSGCSECVIQGPQLDENMDALVCLLGCSRSSAL